MMRARELVAGVAAILLCSGCATYLASIHVDEKTGRFSSPDDERAVLAVTSAVEALEFRRPSDERVLQEAEPDRAYAHRNLAFFVGPRRYRGLTIVVEAHIDGESLRVSLRDSEHGAPTEDFDEILARIRQSLEQAFPEAELTVDARRVRHFFAP